MTDDKGRRHGHQLFITSQTLKRFRDGRARKAMSDHNTAVIVARHDIGETAERRQISLFLPQPPAAHCPGCQKSCTRSSASRTSNSEGASGARRVRTRRPSPCCRHRCASVNESSRRAAATGVPLVEGAAVVYGGLFAVSYVLVLSFRFGYY